MNHPNVTFAQGNKGVNFTLEKPTKDMKNNLRKNLLFTSLDDECRDKMIDQLIEMMVGAQISKGETLIRQGDVGDAFYYIEKGHFNISVQRFDTSQIDSNSSEHDAGNAINGVLNSKPFHITKKSSNI